MSTAHKLAGAVLPSFLRPRPMAARSFSEQSFADTSLKVGTVVAAHSPKSAENFSQSVWEYDVEVMTSHGVEVPTKTLYRNCHLESKFGGISDKYLWTPYVQTYKKDAQGNDTSTIDKPGSVVILECVQGITLYATILGGAQPDGAGAESDSLGDGPTLAWQYNGIRVDINPDGELTLQRRGATRSDGTYVNAQSSNPPQLAFDTLNTTDNDSGCNASVTFTKDGGIGVQTGDGKNSISFDAGGGKITVTADQGVEVVVNQGGIKMSCGAGQAVQISDGVGSLNMSNGTFSFKGASAELVAQITAIVQALLSTTVMTAIGPQPLSPPTITNLTQTLVNLQTLQNQS